MCSQQVVFSKRKRIDPQQNNGAKTIFFSRTHFRSDLLRRISNRKSQKRSLLRHYENIPLQYNGTFYGCKNEKFKMKKKKKKKKCDICVIFARNGDCGYHNLCFIAELRKNYYTPATPFFFFFFSIQKWGFEGVKLHRHVFVIKK